VYCLLPRAAAKLTTGQPVAHLQDRLRLAFVTTQRNDFWATRAHGCQSAAQISANVEVDFRFFTNSTVVGAAGDLSALVASGVDGIAVSPIDADKQTDFLNKIAAKDAVGLRG